MINPTTTAFCTWAAKALPATHQAMLGKLREEVGEFFDAPSGDEAADIIFVLCRWAEAAGVDLNAELAAKFEVVKARTWEQLPDGTWRHIRPMQAISCD